MLRSLIAGLILAAALAPAVHGQAVTVDVPDGATHRIEITGPVRYVYGPTGLTITFGPDPQPAPQPAPAPPGPTPTPEPLPVTPKEPGKVNVTLVYDPSMQSIAAARLMADLSTDGTLEAMQARFRAYAVGDPVIDRLSMRDKLKELPCVLIQYVPDGNAVAPIVATLPAVKDKSAVVEAARKAAK